MEYHFIVNPTAGKKDQSQVIPAQIMAVSEKVGVAAEHCHIVTTQYKGHARVLAKEIAQQGVPCAIFSVGGDGTFNEVLNGAYLYENAIVGCIPHGSGNDFLRSFGERDAFLDLEAQFLGQALEIDLIQSENGVSAAICSVGLDAKIAYGIPKFRRLPLCGGSMAYNLSIAQCLLGKLGQKLTITLDGEVVHKNCLMVAVCNGKAYGGGFYAAPEANLTDGFLDVMIIAKMPLLRVAKVISVYKKGNHLKNGEIVPEMADVITFCRAKTVSITPQQVGESMLLNEDGECAPSTLLQATILPKAAKIILPRGVS
ncbi:MAG: YegS/Rv2252/BmrU family lipid kinase [Faecalibacterium sp.]